MKKVLLFALMISILILAACGGSKDDETGVAASAEGEKLVLRLAGQSPDDHPSTKAINKFAEQVNKETDGNVEIKVYPANQLGDYTTVYEEIGRGTIDMALITLPTPLDSRLDLIYVPYMTKTYADVESNYDENSFIFKKIKEINKDHGVDLLGFHANGFGGLGTTKEITNLLDLGEDKGVLLRAAPSDVFKFPMDDIGFRTVTIPFADLFTALQTGTAEGWAGGEASLNYLGYRDALKYYYQTNDFFNIDSLLINDEKFAGMDEEYKEVVLKYANELMLESFENAESFEKEYLEKLEEEGIEVVLFSEDEIETIASYVRETTWPRLEGPIGKDIIDELLENVK